MYTLGTRMYVEGANIDSLDTKEWVSFENHPSDSFCIFLLRMYIFTKIFNLIN